MHKPATFKKHLGACTLVATALVGSGINVACTPYHVEGGLIGGAAVGYAYEHQNKKARKQLERERASGSISEQEYRRRREDISDRSIIY